MKKWLTLLTVAALGAFIAAPARADVMMYEYFSSAPNAYGSPSWDQYVTNAIAGIQAGGAATGTPDTPSYYQSSSNFDAGQIIVTDYNSWDGQINPAPPYNNELGNRLHDGVEVDGNGQQISLSELTFNMNSSDSGDVLNFTGSFSGSDVYSATRVGIIYGAGGKGDTADYTYVTSGSADQLVDELVYVGIGNALCSGSPGDCGGPYQSIADLEAFVAANEPFTVTNTYSMVDPNGDTLASITSTADIVVTPEPAAVMLFGTMLLGCCFFAWRRRAEAVRK